MKTITRKSMLYKTGVEYGDYTMNHVLGCAHGCKYPCYAYMMARRFGKVLSYGDWIEPKLVSNTLELLDEEIPKLKEKIVSVQLCFTTDPFMRGYSEISDMSIAAIKRLNKDDIQCNVLTKGMLPIELSELSKKNEYGITLISLDEKYRLKMEPNSATYRERIVALKALHEKGCKTWVSIEPYPTPNLIVQNINTILETVAFTDRIIFGRTHYSKEISAYKNNKIFYNEEASKVIKFCKQRNINWYIKQGTISSSYSGI